MVIVGGDMNVAVEDLDIHVTPNIRKQPGSTDE
jgi:exonuclease III